MAKPITIPNTFANATTAIPLSQLDTNYSTIVSNINDAATYSNYAADSGTANTYAITLSGVTTTYAAGTRFQFKASNANTGASTLNVNAQGTKNIFLNGSAITANTILANAVVDVIYDGTQFQMMSPSANVSSISLSSNNNWTGTQTFSGTSSALGAVLTDAAEVATVSATAATGTINYDVTTQSVLFYTTNASANWTVNFRGSSGTSLNTLLSTGQSITVAFLVTNGATAYYNSSVQVDGTTSGVTTRWQDGTAPTAGNASSVDVYAYTIVKTASATFSVFASQTRFA